MKFEQPADMVEAGQRVAGVIAARSRGDIDGVRHLMATFAGPAQLAGGALVVAELAAALLAQQRGESVEACMSELCVDLEEALH